MEDMKGIANAVNALGNNLASMEQELYYERMRRENAEKRVEDLANENERLMKKLNAVESYIAKEGDEWQ